MKAFHISSNIPEAERDHLLRRLAASGSPREAQSVMEAVAEFHGDAVQEITGEGSDDPVGAILAANAGRLFKDIREQLPKALAVAILCLALIGCGAAPRHKVREIQKPLISGDCS